jgi:hypothetical protein
VQVNGVSVVRGTEATAVALLQQQEVVELMLVPVQVGAGGGDKINRGNSHTNEGVTAEDTAKDTAEDTMPGEGGDSSEGEGEEAEAREIGEAALAEYTRRKKARVFKIKVLVLMLAFRLAHSSCD